MTSVALFGSTGLTGSHILTSLLSPTSTFTPVHTISRRAPKPTSESLTAHVEGDTTKWAASIAQINPSVVISALGTTRAAAGGIQNQWKIDHDLNIELAKAAKAAGVKTFVFVSSAGTRGPGHTHMPYCQMKNGVEDAIKELDFEHAVIMKPGTIMGNREESRPGEAGWRKLLNGVGHVLPSVRNALGQDVDAIARATVRATQMAQEGKAPSKYWVIGGSEILQMGQPEEKK